MTTVQTVTGPVDGADLGRTLVHEHIRISYYGEELDPKYSWDRAETVERAVDKMGELLDAGFNISMVAQRQGHGPQVLVKHYARSRPSADRKAAEHLGQVVHRLDRRANEPPGVS